MIEIAEQPSKRIALLVEYDGSEFAGWQRQAAPDLPTVQAALEKSLSSIADTPVSTVCAGRTDSGVHATGQVIHFNCPIDRGEKAWVAGTNSQLPPTVRVQWARAVNPEFHARFSATARRYLYIIYEQKTASALLAGRQLHVRSQLNAEAMHEAAQHLLGEQNFSAFRAAGCQSRSPHRCVHWLRVSRVRRYIVVDVQANAFLQHMVRNIVGMLLEVGRGERHSDWAAELLAGQDRTVGAVTAPPDGLYLVAVTYPEGFGLPQAPLGPVFLQPYP